MKGSTIGAGTAYLSPLVFSGVRVTRSLVLCVFCRPYQGCLLSPLLFTFCIDWVTRETTKNKKTGISWTLSEMLEDLDFADDIALLSHRHRDMQEKTNQLVTSATINRSQNQRCQNQN